MASVRAWDPREDLSTQTPPAQLDYDAAGNWFLHFRAGTRDYAIFAFKVPSTISLTGNLTLRLTWRSADQTQVTQTVRWDAEFACYTPETDSVNTITTAGYATEQSVNDDLLGTTVGRPQDCDITFTPTQADDIQPGDIAKIRISRDIDDAIDDLLNNAHLLAVELLDNA